MGFGRARTASADGSSQATGRVNASNLEATWLLYDFGQREAAIQAADLAAVAASASHDRQRQDVMLEAAAAFFAAVEAGERASINAQQARHVEAVLAHARQPRGDAEAASELVQLQVRTALARLRAEQRAADGAFAQARGELLRRLGLPLAGSTSMVLASLSDLPPVAAEALSPNIAQLLHDHPALRAAQARLDAARAQVNAERRASRPTLSAVVSQSRGRDAFGTATREGALGLQWQVPLYNGGAHEHRVARALSEAAAAAAELDAATDQTVFETWSSHQELLTQSATLNDNEHYLSLAQTLLAKEQAAFERGDGDLFDLIDAGEALAEARRARLSSLSALHLQHLRLGIALGRLGRSPQVR